MKQISILISVLLISNFIFSQPTYSKTFGIKGSNYDYDCSTMIPLENGAVVALGNSIFDKNSSRWDIDFVKLDPKGNVLIQKRFSTDYSSGDVKGIQTSDGGFILFSSQNGLKDKTGKLMRGAALIKLNSNAEVEWSKYYHSEKFSHINTDAVIESKSGGFIIQFSLSHDYYTSNNMGVMKVSPVGEIIWSTTLYPDILYYDLGYFGTSLLETTNGAILCGGYLDTEDTYRDYRNLVIQLDKDGTFKKGLYFNEYDNPFILQKIFQVNREIILYGEPYMFTLNMETPENITGTLMSFQYFLYRKYPSLRPQQQFDLCFFPDGSLIQVFRGYAYQEPGYDVNVKKYDSLSRICPDYKSLDVYDKTSEAKFPLKKLTVHNVNNKYTVTDINIYDSTLNFVHTICEGDVPPQVNLNALKLENISKISIYPNPADNILHVLNLKAGEKYQLTIMNNLGNVFKKSFVENVSIYDFNLSGIKAGVYYLKVQSAKTNASYMF
ncbi:MAG: T9SS type A sorting domain-containing protein, partial [Bacteroidota bacterium]